MHQRLTRLQLHALVWERPVTHLAREFGLSDVALHKICRKHRIPTPPPGYWAKKAVGKAPRTTALPEPADTSEILIRESSASNEPEVMGEARTRVLAALQSQSARSSEAPDPIVERTLARLASAKPRADGLVHVKGSGLVTIAVRPVSIERVAEFLPELEAAASMAGIRLARGEGAATWLHEDQPIAFELIEATDKVEHVATEKELSAVAKWKREREERHRRHGYWQDWGEPKIPKWEQRYQGRLMIRLENVRVKTERNPWGEPIRHAFAETRIRRIERSVPAILSTIAAMVQAKRSNGEFEIRQREAAAERARRYAEEERKRIAEARAIRLLDQLIEEQTRADRLNALLELLRTQQLDLRGKSMLDWAQARLDGMRLELSGPILEQRLAASDLFNPPGLLTNPSPCSAPDTHRP